MPKFNKQTARQAGKSSSRKGIPNKATKDIREVLTAICNDQVSKVSDMLSALESDPEKWLKMYDRLLTFVLSRYPDNLPGESNDQDEPVYVVLNGVPIKIA